MMNNEREVKRKRGKFLQVKCNSPKREEEEGSDTGKSSWETNKGFEKSKSVDKITKLRAKTLYVYLFLTVKHLFWRNKKIILQICNIMVAYRLSVRILIGN